MIQSKAMLTRLSISQWTARKYDKSVSSEVEKAHSAHDAGRFNKLLVNKSLLEPISKLTGVIRTFHYHTTLPWSDGGDRLLPSILFMQYTQQMRAYKAEFAKLVSEFAHSYPTEVQAARNRLGTMYNPADYPDVSEMYARFDVTTEFIPIPDAKDFRVDVSAEAADEIRQQITESVNMRQVEAVRDCYKRVREVVSKLYDRLSIEDAVFKDSLVSNAQALMDVLPGLNITQDPELDALHTEISATLLVSPNTLRNDPATRENTAKIAKTILDRMPA
jgi:hypothetical protein